MAKERPQTVENTGYATSYSSSSATFCDVILAILFPPLGVFFKYGCDVEFWISVLLTILGYIPGILYALYVIV